MHIIFDLSRLLWRANRFAPTGIDRVELAYARYLIRTARNRLSFAAWWGQLGLLPLAAAVAFVEALDAFWSESDLDPAARRQAAAMARRLRVHALLQGERALYAHAQRCGDRLVYLLVSHYRLHRPAALERLKQRTGMRLICLIHDLIPIDHPEHMERGSPERHRQRVDTVARLADAVIVNSHGTEAGLQRHFAGPLPIPLVVAPLGIDLHRPAKAVAPAERPYFVCLATIEPRKNHRLLFDLWARLAAAGGSRAPRLVLIGRRGAQSRHILRPIAQSGALGGLVEQHNALPDGAVARWLAGAQALLYPSFAEGYGLPVAEALALRVPVICSDLAELREVGRAVPEYLDPRDAAAWGEMVLDYAAPGSLRRCAQFARLADWQAPTWEAHFALVQPLIDCDLPPSRPAAEAVGRTANAGGDAEIARAG